MSKLKKYIPHILIVLILGAVILLIFNSPQGDSKKILNERLSFFRQDKIPYGDYVAYKQLPHMFPQAKVMVNTKKPGEWDSLSSYDEGQAMIIISPQFRPNSDEMRSLISFAENGNDVFISAMNLPYDIEQMLKCNVSSPRQYMEVFGEFVRNDTLTVSLAGPAFRGAESYTYPGKRYDGYFNSTNSQTTTILGYDDANNPDFIHLKAGKGNLYVHLAPMALTNYFLLHKKNIAYYEKIMSLMSSRTNKVVWDEYFRLKKEERPDRKNKNWLSVLLNLEIKTVEGDPANEKKPFKIAFWLLLLLLLLYTIMEMRRKQRIIPVYRKPGNDSLDFVKTIGRLYHDKGDHGNLCRKMAAYFLEHVRNRYKLPTNNLNDEFIMSLHTKTAIPQDEIKDIVSAIKNLEGNYNVSSAMLVRFHDQLETFYNKE